MADERLWTPTFTAVIRQDGPWWLGWVEQVPGVNAQEHTREELLASLRQVLHEALEFNRHEAPTTSKVVRPVRPIHQGAKP